MTPDEERLRALREKVLEGERARRELEELQSLQAQLSVQQLPRSNAVPAQNHAQGLANGGSHPLQQQQLQQAALMSAQAGPSTRPTQHQAQTISPPVNALPNVYRTLQGQSTQSYAGTSFGGGMASEASTSRQQQQATSQAAIANNNLALRQRQQAALLRSMYQYPGANGMQNLNNGQSYMLPNEQMPSFPQIMSTPVQQAHRLAQEPVAPPLQAPIPRHPVQSPPTVPAPTASHNPTQISSVQTQGYQVSQLQPGPSHQVQYHPQQQSSTSTVQTQGFQVSQPQAMVQPGPNHQMQQHPPPQHPSTSTVAVNPTTQRFAPLQPPSGPQPTPGRPSRKEKTFIVDVPSWPGSHVQHFLDSMRTFEKFAPVDSTIDVESAHNFGKGFEIRKNANGVFFVHKASLLSCPMAQLASELIKRATSEVAPPQQPPIQPPTISQAMGTSAAPTQPTGPTPQGQAVQQARVPPAQSAMQSVFKTQAQVPHTTVNQSSVSLAQGSTSQRPLQVQGQSVPVQVSIQPGQGQVPTSTFAQQWGATGSYPMSTGLGDLVSEANSAAKAPEPPRPQTAPRPPPVHRSPAQANLKTLASDILVALGKRQRSNDAEAAASLPPEKRHATIPLGVTSVGPVGSGPVPYHVAAAGPSGSSAYRILTVTRPPEVPQVPSPMPDPVVVPITLSAARAMNALTPPPISSAVPTPPPQPPVVVVPSQPRVSTPPPAKMHLPGRLPTPPPTDVAAPPNVPEPSPAAVPLQTRVRSPPPVASSSRLPVYPVVQVASASSLPRIATIQDADSSRASTPVPARGKSKTSSSRALSEEIPLPPPLSPTPSRTKELPSRASPMQIDKGKGKAAFSREMSEEIPLPTPTASKSKKKKSEKASSPASSREVIDLTMEQTPSPVVSEALFLPGSRESSLEPNFDLAGAQTRGRSSKRRVIPVVLIPPPSPRTRKFIKACKAKATQPKDEEVVDVEEGPSRPRSSVSLRSSSRTATLAARHVSEEEEAIDVSAEYVYSYDVQGTKIQDEADRALMKIACTRLQRLECKWDGCDAVMNSVIAVHLHLMRVHKPVLKNSLSTTFSCRWSACGKDCRLGTTTRHFVGHAVGFLTCPYIGCDHSSRTVGHLRRHLEDPDQEVEHKTLKPSTVPFRPGGLAPPPAVPDVLPSYMVISRVKAASISAARHAMLEPKIFQKIAGLAREGPPSRRHGQKRPAAGESLISQEEILDHPCRASMHLSSPADPRLKLQCLTEEGVDSVWMTRVSILGKVSLFDQGSEYATIDWDGLEEEVEVKEEERSPTPGRVLRSEPDDPLLLRSPSASGSRMAPEDIPGIAVLGAHGEEEDGEEQEGVQQGDQGQMVQGEEGEEDELFGGYDDPSVEDDEDSDPEVVAQMLL